MCVSFISARIEIKFQISHGNIISSLLFDGNMQAFVVLAHVDKLMPRTDTSRDLGQVTKD
jgi:hypothetical protein